MNSHVEKRLKCVAFAVRNKKLKSYFMESNCGALHFIFRLQTNSRIQTEVLLLKLKHRFYAKMHSVNILILELHYFNRYWVKLSAASMEI